MTENTPSVPEIVLTEADRQKIRSEAEKIDLNDAALCLTYGTAGQKQLAAVSDRLLKMAQADDTADIGEEMAAFVKELRDASEVKLRRGPFGFLFRRRDRKNLRKRYGTAAENADRIAAGLERHRNTLLRDHVMLGKLYDAVLVQYRELTVAVEAGQRTLDTDTAAGREQRERFEKRLHDLRLSRTVCMQTLTQITLLRDCNAVLSEKLQSLLTNTVALWKNQTAAALAVKNTGQAAEDLRRANGAIIGVLEEVCSAENEREGYEDALAAVHSRKETGETANKGELL